MKMMGSAGSFVGPFFIGVTSDAFGSFTPAMLMLAACLLGAAAMQLFFHEPGESLALHPPAHVGRRSLLCAGFIKTHPNDL